LIRDGSCVSLKTLMSNEQPPPTRTTSTNEETNLPYYGGGSLSAPTIGPNRHGSPDGLAGRPAAWNAQDVRWGPKEHTCAQLEPPGTCAL